MSAIVVTIEGGPRLVKFPYFWAKIVTGFDPRVHCAKCLRGTYIKPGGRWSPPMNVATAYDVPTGAVALYFCGVSAGGWAHNFHAPLAPARGGQVVLPMYAGQVFVADDARLLPIPPLPEGFAGLPKSFWHCRNYQFGCAYFGHPAAPRDLFHVEPST